MSKLFGNEVLIMFVVWVTDSVNTIFINEKYRNQLQDKKENVVLRIGSWKSIVKVMYVSHMGEDTIGLSDNIRDSINLPTELPYEILFQSKEIHIGPVIGICISNSRTLTVREVEKHVSRFSNYDVIKGLVFLFSSVEIDTKKKMVEGYYYVPNLGLTQKNFIRSRFPYPGSVYKRVSMNDSKSLDLRKTIGDKIFNWYIFNKLELWEWTISNTEARNSLPYTEQLKNRETVFRMLRKYKSVYIKPINGSLGKGIIKITKRNKRFLVKKHNTQKYIQYTKLQISQYISNLLLKKRYIIQQDVAITRYNKIVDFRIYMQKNKSKNWTFMGYIARFAKKNKITTNAKNLDTVYEGRKGMKLAFAFTDNQAMELEEKLKTCCMNICNVIDQRGGHYGDVAIDVVIDTDYNVWILEINKRYFAKNLTKINDQKQLYYMVRSKPLEYAKTLAGFY